jgi:hypothetical protein
MVQESAVKRALVVALLALAVPAPAAAATHECDGLDVCISVPGPWVLVPASARTATRVEYQLTCPRNSVAAGLDTVVSDARLNLTFLGAIGSPVSPGVTTQRSVVFIALRSAQTPAIFRPYLGCVPTSGGGGRATTAVVQARPIVRRVKTLRTPGSATYACRRGERIVGASHAIAFRTERPPTAAWLNAVRVTRRARGNSVFVSARRTDSIPPGVRVQVQVHLLCATGPA